MAAHRTHGLVRASAVLVVLPVLLAMFGSGTARGQDDPVVLVTEVRGPITPVIASHLTDAVRVAEERSATALVVELDTPGGLVTSMRLIVQTFLGSDVPVVVHVTPAGADAGSAGTFITLAAHVAAMAPATTIGAATPVDLQGGEIGDKIVNNAAAYAEAIAQARGRDVDFAVASVREGRSITARDALAADVVDLLAEDLADLLEALDGRSVELPNDRVVTLATADATVERIEMSVTRRVLQLLADPNLAFLLLSMATLAILYEIANPGIGAGGVTGAVALILGLYALSVLPVEFAGVALVIVAGVLFAAEVITPGIGVAAAGGTVALLLGGLFLFQRPTGIGVDAQVLYPTVAVSAGLAVLIGVAARRARDLPLHGAAEDLVGRHATATRGAGGQLRVRLDGTWWRATPADDAGDVADGTDVVVVARDNLDLYVAPAPPPTNKERS